MVKPNTTTEDGGDHGAGGILREQDEADEYRDGQDEAAQDGLRGALDLRGDEADNGAGDEADAVGADEADDVHEVAVGVEALREVRRGVGSALVHGVAGEVRDAGPDDAGVLDGLDGLLDAEQLGVLVDLALEVGDDEEGDDAQDGDDDARKMSMACTPAEPEMAAMMPALMRPMTRPVTP